MGYIRRLDRIITVVGCHAEGEVGRVITGGVLPPPGAGVVCTNLMHSDLAWSCFDCHRFKGSDIASLDTISGGLIPLLNPREESWHEHFHFEAGKFVGEYQARCTLRASGLFLSSMAVTTSP